jgi:1-acyl-sn-glycerol-3-phosphate acyltransferase
MRRFVTRFFRLCLKIFFRRIEVIGLERLPEGAVILAANHPNGLVDPLFLLCYTPRPVSFLGKAPLLRYPLIGWFVRAFETIPVYRRQDGTSGSNRETFERARSVLRRGGAIAIFPEGTTHDDPRLRELKTGAARIAIGASADGVQVVPAGIYYTAKHRFRSAAMLVFGDPVPVAPAPVDDAGEPPRADVDALTARIGSALDEVTVQADSHAALALVGLAEDLFSADPRQPLWDELQLRRRFIEAYHRLRTNDPQRLQRLQSLVEQLDAELRGARLEVHDLRPQVTASALFRILVLLPLAILGAAISLVPYVVVSILVRRFAKGEGALMATVKLIAALAVYPLWWAMLAVAVWRFGGAAWTGVFVLMAPVLSWIALVVIEQADEVLGDLRALRLRAFSRHAHESLVTRQRAIREEFMNVAREG